MERILLSFDVFGHVVELKLYYALLMAVLLTYATLWAGYMASWRNALYSVATKYYPPYFRPFLAKQKLLMLLLAIPIVQIPWIFILLFALRHAMLNHGKAKTRCTNFGFFHLGVFVMGLQFLGFGLLVNADSNNEKWFAVLMQFFILSLALWQWLLMARVKEQIA